MPDSEFEELRRTAADHGTTVSEWVRQALRRAGKDKASADVERKLAAIRVAGQYCFPAPDIEIMLEEIERGYLGE